MGPPDCWARLPTPSFYQKANPEEEAKTPSPSLFLLSSSSSLLRRPPTSISVHLNPLGFSRTAYTYPPTNTTTTTTSNAAVATTTTITSGQLGSLAPRVPRPAALFPPHVTLYLLPLVGSGACPYRVCYYYLTLSIIPKRAGSPLRDCDSPRD